MTGTTQKRLAELVLAAVGSTVSNKSVANEAKTTGSQGGTIGVRTKASTH